MLGGDKEPSEKQNVPRLLSGSPPRPAPPSRCASGTAAAHRSPASPYLAIASLARRSVDCCAGAAPLSCLPDCRLRPLTPPTPARGRGICCCVTMRTTASVFKNSRDFVLKSNSLYVCVCVEGGGHLYPLYAVPMPPLYRVDGGEFSRFCRSGCLGSFVFLGWGLLYVSSLPMKLDIP